MKKIIIAFCAFSLSLVSFAQKLKTVHSITEIRHDNSWYIEQQKLWKAEIEKNDQNAEAWYNYYSATRALKNVVSDLEEKKKYVDACNKIADSVIKVIPETFEANHIYWWNCGNNYAHIDYLFKAHKLSPNDPRVLDDLMVHYELVQDKENFEKMAFKIIEINELPASMINWGYNLLSELDDNAIVFTAGDNDTYSLWLAQNGQNFRKDVTVLNVWLIAFRPEYRKRIFTKLGIKQDEISAEDPDAMKKVINHIKENYDKPIYISTTCGNLTEGEDKDKFYITGLSYKYSNDEVDNMSLIRRNYEKRYLLDYLYATFSTHISDQNALHFESLYLPSLIKLYNHYKKSEEVQKKEEIKVLIKRIAERTGNTENIKDFLKDCE